jgi:hypothetical protein
VGIKYKLGEPSSASAGLDNNKEFLQAKGRRDQLVLPPKEIFAE